MVAVMPIFTVPLSLRFVGVGARRVRALFQAAKKKVFLCSFFF
jgi:ATP-dependent 26S proteasome regulatory subunit